jgi:hypothetical protein
MKFYLLIAFLLSLNSQAKLFKISESGELLKENSKEWSCVLDQSTDLIWEVKSNLPGLRFKDNTYTWFDQKTGVENGEFSKNCNWQDSCNSKKYIAKLKERNVCNQNNWRLPTEKELNSLIIYGDDEPLINSRFFPNTKKGHYWSSTSFLEKPNLAIDVPFFYGGSRGSDKSFDSFLRAVSDAN